MPIDYPQRTGLPLQLVPDDLREIGNDVFGRQQFMQMDAADALARMIEEARQDGVTLQVVSVFRSVEYQVELIRKKLRAGQTIDEVLSVIAAPGFSEHHSGRAVDLTTPASDPLEEQFEYTGAFTWLQKRAGEFSFVMSYPRDNRFGVIFEPWHWCFRPEASV